MLLTGHGRLLGLMALIALPLATADDTVLTYADLFLILGVAVLGLSVQQGMAGIVSLGPGATVGVGAYASAALSHHTHWPMPLPLLAAVAVAPPCALLFGGAALLLTRVHFAMVSLYAALLVPVVALQGGFLTGGPGGLTDVEPLEIAGWRPVGAALYGVLAAVLVVAAALVTRLCEGRWGRAFMAVRDDASAAGSVGIPALGARLRAVMVAALCGAVAGALFMHAWPGNCPSGYAGATCVIGPDYFGLDLSVLLFAAATIGGAGSRAGPLAALAALVVLRWYFDTHSAVSGNWQTVAYGTLLVGSVVAVPGGLGAGLRLLQARPRPRPVSPADAGPPRLPEPRWQGARLSVRGLRAAFDGTVALAGVGLDVTPGEIHALIGPNGSGKTTVLNCIAGEIRPHDGEVALDGRALPAPRRPRPHLRARAGVARTFQTPRVQADLDVLENVLQGLFLDPGPVRAPAPAPDPEPGRRARAVEALRAVGLEHRATVAAARLPHGERRLLELARALALGPAVLLLDEPATGLDAASAERLRELLRAFRGWGPAVVIVEHHLDLVLEVADTVTVLEHGRVAAQGPPDAVRSDPAVARVFMGRPR